MRPIPAALLLAATCLAQTSRDGAFVRDGRSLAWRMVFAPGTDTSKSLPAYFHLHGNNSGTQQQMLDYFEYNALRQTNKRGGIGIVLASPEYCTGSTTTRCWYAEKDGPLLAAAIRSGFDGALRIDTNHVTLHGASQGTCFLDQFLQTQRVGWGGGAYLECGCHSADYAKVPDDAWRPKFRVFVSSTTGDFLHPEGFQMADHFQYWSGLPVRSSLTNAGGHCETPQATDDSALDWLTGRLEIAQPAFVPHWERHGPFPKLHSLAVSPSGTQWVATTNDTTSRIWESRDGGRSWSEALALRDSFTTYRYDTTTYVFPEGLGGIAAVGEVLAVTHRDSLYVLGASGVIRRSRAPATSMPLQSDGAGRLWGNAFPWTWSRDTGATWTATPSNWQSLHAMSRAAFGNASPIPPLFARYGAEGYSILALSSDLSKVDSTRPPDTLKNAVRAGDSLWALSWDGIRQNLWRRVGTSPWTKLDWPAADGLAADSTQWSSELAIGIDGRLMVLGTPSFRQKTGGGWDRMPGGWFAFDDDPGAFVPDGRILRVASNHEGLLAWVPTADLSIWSSLAVTPRARSIDRMRVVRDGPDLVLPSGGSYQLRWIDARGRTLHRIALPGGSRLRATGRAAAAGPQWIEVVGPSSRDVFAVAGTDPASR